MSSIVPSNKSAPLAPRVVRVTTAVVTVLALAGAVATATLIFAVGLSVLWPALIACACLTVLCAVGFLIAHCIIASTPLFRKVVEDCITLLKKMGKDMSLSDALRTLVEKEDANILENDIVAICECIRKILVLKSGFLNNEQLNLRDLREAQENRIASIEIHCLVLSKSFYLPILIAVLLLIPHSRFLIEDKGGYWSIVNCSLAENNGDFVAKNAENILFSTVNYGDSVPKTGGQQWVTQKIVKQIGRDNVFVTHYGGNGTLVIDPPPQAES